MVFFSGLVVWALMVSAEGGVGPSTNLSFCTESKECLEYELVCSTDEYEVRHYGPTRWVSTDAEAYFLGVGAAMAFRRLFQYITGANVGGVQMEMTAPVQVRIPEDTRVWEPAVYTLNFLLPSAYQDKPPVPTNDKLYFTDMPAMNVYVRSYGGWMLSVTSRLHAHLLTQELGRVHAPYNHTYHYGVGYDSPLKLLNRHNEVWYVAEGDVVCTDPQEPTPAHTPTPTHTPSDTHTLSNTHTTSGTNTPADTQSPSDAHPRSDMQTLSETHTPSNTHTLSNNPTHTPSSPPPSSSHTPSSPPPSPSHTPSNTPSHPPPSSSSSPSPPSSASPPPPSPSNTPPNTASVVEFH